MLCLVPHTLAAILAGKNFDPALPSKTLERAAKDESMDKAVGEGVEELPYRPFVSAGADLRRGAFS